MNDLRAAAAERKCNFVPGADNPAARASDRAHPLNRFTGTRRITTSDPSARPTAIAGGPAPSATSPRLVTALAGSGTLAISRACGAKLTMRRWLRSSEGAAMSATPSPSKSATAAMSIARVPAM